jgi:cytochrome c
MAPKAIPILLAFTLAASLAGPSRAAAPPADVDQLQWGARLIQRNCGMCHAVGRVGFSPNPQAPPFRDLHLRYEVETLAEALAEGILTGHPAMPEFRFEPSEVKAIVAYLRSIQSKRLTEGPALKSSR